jgi:myo-inositol-1(or 4)-monophosphatase
MATERMEPSELAEVALESARLAVEVQRRHAGRVSVSEWSEKGPSDFVTAVDREAEAVLIEHIRRRCPGHDIMAEESTELGNAASILRRFEGGSPVWLVDPLDGTTNYLHGYPSYAASVAVAVDGVVVAGAVIDGAHGTEWSGWHGGGAWRDGERIEVSTIDQLDRSLVGTGFPFKVLELLPAYLSQFQMVLPRTSGIRRAGSAALDLCHVADGRLDGFWELWLAPWDIAAGTLLIREAGGVVTTLEGADDVRSGGAIVAGNPTVHGKLLGLLVENPAADRV